MKFDIKKHIYLILLFILSFTVETAQSQEVTNIHIAATDTVPTYTSDSAVINFLKDAGIPITQNSKLKLLKSGWRNSSISLKKYGMPNIIST